MARLDLRILERLPVAANRPATSYGVTLILVSAAYLVRVAAGSILPPGLPFVTFFPAVVLSAFLFGTRQGTLAAILCGLIAWYYFVPPFGSFALDTGAITALALYLFVVVVDIALIHFMQKATRRLGRERETSRALAARGAVLFEELQHRVSNNLQVAAALLTLQKRTIDDPAAGAALDEAARRLALIGRISRRLYEADGATASLDELLRTLYTDVIEASGKPAITGAIAIDPTIRISADAAVPVALIFAESVANAIEHGVAGREAGAIDVTLRRSSDTEVELLVADDGAGLPSGFSLDSVNSLGLRISQTLAQQLRGRFSLEGGRGTTAKLVLPA